MRKIYLILIICTLGLPFSLFAQDGGVSIGKGGVDAELSAILELVSKSKGFLAPRMTSTEREAIVAPVNGLLVYDSTEDCYYCYASGKWSHIGDIQMNIGSSYPVKAQEGDFSFNPETKLLYVKSGASWVQVGSKKPELRLEGSVISVREQDSESSSSVNLAEWLNNYIDASLVSLSSQYVKPANGGVLVAGESVQSALGKLEKNLENVSVSGGEANTIIFTNKTQIAENMQAIKDTASQIRAAMSSSTAITRNMIQSNTLAIAGSLKALNDTASQIRTDMNRGNSNTEAVINNLETKLKADSTITRNLIQNNITNIADNLKALNDTASQIRADMNRGNSSTEAVIKSLETKLKADSTITRNLIQNNITNIADNLKALNDTASQIRADMNRGNSNTEAVINNLETKLKADSTITRNLIQSNITNIADNLKALNDTASQIRADMNRGNSSTEAVIKSLETKLKADSTITRNLIQGNTTNIATNTSAIANNLQALKDTASQIRADMNRGNSSTEAVIKSLETKLKADSTITRNLIQGNTTNIATNTSAIANNLQALKDTASQIRADMNRGNSSTEAVIKSLETKLKADSTITRNLIQGNTTNIATNISAIANNLQALKDTASQIRADMNRENSNTVAVINSLETKLKADSTVTRNLIQGNTTNIATNTSAIAGLESEKLAKTTGFSGDVTGNYNATVIANNAINSSKIQDGTILAADLNQMSATNGQVLSWNGTKNTWEATSVAARSYTQKFEEDDSVPTLHALAKTAIVNDASSSCSVTLNGETLDPTCYTFTSSTLKLLVPVYTYDKVTVTYCY